MYNVNDTIIAVSSGQTPSIKKIIRISGDKTLDILKSLAGQDIQNQRTISNFTITIEGLKTESLLYLFPSPNSYTGENVAEIHICACEEAVNTLFSKLLSLGCRGALAGEFTYRAYINGKMDLSRAEAVAEIIESSNQYQLLAAQRLFGGSIEQKVSQIKKEIFELLSLIEAGLDFSAEDIEIISTKKAGENAKKIRSELDELLYGSITFEQISQAPSVVIAGAANAGKSSLVNALVGENRSIVSEQSGTTRDVLEHWLKLEKCDCVLLDSAGVIVEPGDILQSLANEAAMKAIKDATILIFCADITKEDYTTDMRILVNIKELDSRSPIAVEDKLRGNDTTAWASADAKAMADRKAHPTKTHIVFITTKSDLLSRDETIKKIMNLKNIFGHSFLITSAKDNLGLEKLKDLIEENIIAGTCCAGEAAGKTAITERHRKAVTESIINIDNANNELQKDNQEIAAFLLRAAIQHLSSLETEHIDEKILDTIFSRFCIGK